MGCSPNKPPSSSRRVFAPGARNAPPASASPIKRTASSESSTSSNSSSSSSSSNNNGPGRRRNPARRAAPSVPPAPALVLACFLGLLQLLLLPQPVAAKKQIGVGHRPTKNLTSHMHADAALFPSAALKTFDRQVRELVANGSVNGARVLGAQAGRVILDYSLGYNEEEEPWFRLFSMTKPVTAALTLALAEEGVLSLDDEFALYVPELGKLTVYDGIEELLVEEEEELLGGSEIERRDAKQKQKRRRPFLSHPAPRNATIRELLTHTAGFAYGDNVGHHPVDDAYDTAFLQDFYRHTEKTFLRKLAHIPLLTEPGTEFHYSLGFDVLGIALSRATKKPLDQLMQEKIFKPLGMRHTAFHLSKGKAALLAPMAEEEDFGTGIFNFIADVESSKGETDPSFKSGGGGLMGTAPDYLRFAQMLLNGGQLDGVRVLSEASVAAMTSNQLPAALLPYHLTSFPDYNGSAFGFGVMVIDDGEVSPSSPKGEASWAGMASNSWWISPEHKTALVAMTQHIPYHAELQDTVKPFFYNAVHEQQRRLVASPSSLRGGGRKREASAAQ